MNKETLRLYTELLLKQVNKKHYRACGDQAEIVRSMEHTDFILADGIGSGSYANIAARMCISRMLSLMRSGVSIHNACEKVLKLMHRARSEKVPFAAFNIARIMKGGQFTCLSFEAPLPLLVRDGIVQKLRTTHYTLSNEVVSETSVLLKEGDSMVFFTDGVTQAGLGRGMGMGWGEDGFQDLYQKCISAGMTIDDALDIILMKTKRLSGDENGDDTSIAVLTLRKASVINILSGPRRQQNGRREAGEAVLKKRRAEGGLRLHHRGYDRPRDGKAREDAGNARFPYRPAGVHHRRY